MSDNSFRYKKGLLSLKFMSIRDTNNSLSLSFGMKQPCVVIITLLYICIQLYFSN